MEAAELIERGAKTLRAAAERFSTSGQHKADAIEILEEVLGGSFDDDHPVTASQARRFERMIERRATGEPMPYILGWAEFRDLRLSVKRGGFFPRATTEFLAEQAIRRIRRRSKPIAVDLATGIGPVALAIANEVKGARVYGTDIAASALAQARGNAKSLRLRNVTFHLGSLWAPLPVAVCGRVDVATVHPPYVPKGEVKDLPDEIRAFEPPESLTDQSDDGMGLVRELIADGRDWLRPGGWMCIEVDPTVSRTVKSLLARGGYREVRSTTGPLSYTRVIVGKNPPA